MKHKIQKVELFVGVIVLLGGLLTYGLGVHQLLPVLLQERLASRQEQKL